MRHYLLLSVTKSILFRYLFMDSLNPEKFIELVSAAKKGNQDAFSAIYAHYFTPIFRFIFLRVKNRADAEDLTQSTFLKAWNKIFDYQQREMPFSSWLYSIARNTVIDFWRKRKEYEISEPKNSSTSRETSVEDLLEKEEALSLVEEAIKLLTDEQQEVIILRFVEDLSYQEISQIMEKNQDAVRQIYSRAIKILKERLKNENERKGN